MSFHLQPHKGFPGVEGPVLICVMDGVGVGRRDESDAVWLARTPNLDRLHEIALCTQLIAHGRGVGMPSDDDMGNSEVGHNALGAGRIVDQGAKLVGRAITSGSLFAGPVWQSITQRVRESGEALHFLGLLSDGNVHSHIDHLFALLGRCDAEDVHMVRIHVLLDGRDVAETSALEFIDALEVMLRGISQKKQRDYRIASGGGRMTITMDRYGADWNMVERGWNTHVHAEGRRFTSAREAIETYRDEDKDIGDQFLPAFIIADDVSGVDEPIGPIRDGAAVVYLNFRGDRALEISEAFESETFQHFDRGQRPDVLYAGMMQYDGDLLIPNRFLVDPPDIDRTMGEHLVRNGVSLLAVSETQKFGHVTFFWNGNKSGCFDDQRETYIEIPSDRVPFEERPWMKAAEITDTVLAELATGRYKHARLNYANGDMVGHTGDRDASIKAVEVVDAEIGRLIPLIEKMKGALVVTADHGNADCMYEFDPETGEVKRDASGAIAAKTSHTLNPVPLAIYAPGHRLELDPNITGASLGNIAATLLQLHGLQAPEDYDVSLLR
ncbi:MAG: 2,3-bisphosphoglycerate-independent phosphoglycerate mutase [Myxococcales bacterium]|nr:2,3-bisphosphoglycerate-independent phosphoglycerate mutase [Myxococcales bacterium]